MRVGCFFLLPEMVGASVSFAQYPEGKESSDLLLYTGVVSLFYPLELFKKVHLTPSTIKPVFYASNISKSSQITP